eukprot:gnl/TRDRNA2_/TRDRNA2_37010_c0_seq1.p1 gnl/TRDRNA2_/TRDRNA2_37010_c0~~gnl/TRDRNA2_/TRDRNA2_37010_c0_seq1.p1  ORF type:complete len:448 (-),score=95.52 gnl/TRDRNA2_/TRDRNA2_37010_c0_seq1:84-1427(-)
MEMLVVVVLCCLAADSASSLRVLREEPWEDFSLEQTQPALLRRWKRRPSRHPAHEEYAGDVSATDSPVQPAKRSESVGLIATATRTEADSEMPTQPKMSAEQSRTVKTESLLPAQKKASTEQISNTGEASKKLPSPSALLAVQTKVEADTQRRSSPDLQTRRSLADAAYQSAKTDAEAQQMYERVMAATDPAAELDKIRRGLDEKADLLLFQHPEAVFKQSSTLDEASKLEESTAAKNEMSLPAALLSIQTKVEPELPQSPNTKESITVKKEMPSSAVLLATQTKKTQGDTEHSSDTDGAITMRTRRRLADVAYQKARSTSEAQRLYDRVMKAADPTAEFDKIKHEARAEQSSPADKESKLQESTMSKVKTELSLPAALLTTQTKVEADTKERSTTDEASNLQEAKRKRILAMQVVDPAAEANKIMNSKDPLAELAAMKTELEQLAW